MLVTDLMREAPPSQTEGLRSGLEQAGVVELGHRGTRRLSPWRRTLACETLGKIGARREGPYGRNARCDRWHDRGPRRTSEAIVIAVCERLERAEVASLDRRHFTVVRPHHIEALTLLPE